MFLLKQQENVLMQFITIFYNLKLENDRCKKIKTLFRNKKVKKKDWKYFVKQVCTQIKRLNTVI